MKEAIIWQKAETETETKFTETKRNLPKRNEIDAKRNKSKRN
jgi:hypothetical protein